jgi:hypothetical protein
MNICVSENTVKELMGLAGLQGIPKRKGARYLKVTVSTDDLVSQFTGMGRPPVVRSPSPTLRSAIKPHVPIGGLRTSGAGGNTPRPYQLQGAKSHAGTAGAFPSRTLLARAHPRR